MTVTIYTEVPTSQYWLDWVKKQDGNWFIFAGCGGYDLEEVVSMTTANGCDKVFISDGKAIHHGIVQTL